MKMIYGIKDRPKFGQLVLFSLQQLLAIIAATILVPMLTNIYGAKNLQMDPAAALVGAGVGTLVYILFTRRRSPVFLGSSFAFLNSMYAATAFGYLGLFFGAVFAGLVYVLVAVIIRFVGSGWLNKLLPPVIIGPTIALIGLSLAGSAVNNLNNTASGSQGYNLIHVLCGLFAFFVVIVFSVKGTKTMRMIPFIFGILGGYVLACLFTAIGAIANVDYLRVVDFSAFKAAFSPFTFESVLSVPDFAFIHIFRELGDFDWSVIGTIAVLYAPVAFVVMAEHIGDHKNLSSVLSDGENQVDLLTEPGLDKTLLGDGVGSIAGAFFGGCPNTTYGESVGCIAITRNASLYSIFGASLGAILLAFFTPFVAFVNTIPSCIIGGICLALYGFIAVSGLKMLQQVDLDRSHNLFVVSSILISGIGGLALSFGEHFTVTPIATALILGIVTNLALSKLPSFAKEEPSEKSSDEDISEE